MIKKTLIIACGCVLTAIFTMAGDFSRNNLGTTGAQFLELPVGARSIAMGSAGAALPEKASDATSLYYNPAGLAGLTGWNISLMNAWYFQNVSYQYGAVAKGMGGGRTIAAGIQYLSPGKLNEIDNTGTATGDSFKPDDLALSLGYAIKINPILDLGLAGKYIRSQIQSEKASALAGDCGVRLNFDDAFTLAASAANIGGKFKYLNQKDDLPMTYRIGASYTYGDLLMEVDAIAPRGAAIYFAGGAEYGLYKARDFVLLGRAGYNSRNSSSKLDGTIGLSAGAGFKWKDFLVDYAWSSFGDLGNAHRVSLTMKIGDSKKLTTKNLYAQPQNIESPVALASVQVSSSTLPVIISTNAPVESSTAPAVTSGGPEQEKPLTNSDIMFLVKANINDMDIIKLVQTRQAAFVLTAESVLELKKAGVSAKVVEAMSAKTTPSAVLVSSGAPIVALSTETIINGSTLAANGIIASDNASNINLQLSTAPATATFVQEKSATVSLSTGTITDPLPSTPADTKKPASTTPTDTEAIPQLPLPEPPEKDNKNTPLDGLFHINLPE